MASFLVESYVPKQADPEPSELAARLGAAAEALGVAVHFLRVISIPEDEICFYLFEAPSAEAVRLVSERAGGTSSRTDPGRAPVSAGRFDPA